MEPREFSFFWIIGGESVYLLFVSSKKLVRRGEYDNVGISSNQREKCVNMVSWLVGYRHPSSSTVACHLVLSPNTVIRHPILLSIMRHRNCIVIVQYCTYSHQQSDIWYPDLDDHIGYWVLVTGWWYCEITVSNDGSQTLHSNYDNMHKNGIFYVLICINNYITTCVNCMLSRALKRRFNNLFIVWVHLKAMNSIVMDFTIY